MLSPRQCHLRFDRAIENSILRGGASPAKNNCSAWGAGLPLTTTGRSSRFELWLCGKAAVAATGVTNTSNRSKNSTRGEDRVKDQTAATPAVPGNARRASTRLVQREPSDRVVAIGLRDWWLGDLYPNQLNLFAY